MYTSQPNNTWVEPKSTRQFAEYVLACPNTIHTFATNEAYVNNADTTETYEIVCADVYNNGEYYAAIGFDLPPTTILEDAVWVGKLEHYNSELEEELEPQSMKCVNELIDLIIKFKKAVGANNNRIYVDTEYVVYL